MNWIKRISLAVVISFTASMVQAAPVIEKPAVLTEAMVSVAVSDLHGFIDGLGTVVEKSSPMMNGMMLKTMLGGQLGDPGLTGVAPGTGLAVVMQDVTNVYAFVEVAEAQSAVYAQAAAAQGMQAQYANGVLVLGQTPEGLTNAVAMAEKVQEKLLARRTPSLRITGQPAALVERHNETLEGFLQMLPSMMGMGMPPAAGMTNNPIENVSKILEGEMRILLSIASQCKACEIELAPKGGALQITETFVPKAGTRLATLVNAPKVGKANPKIQSGLLGDAMMSVDFTMGNPDAISAFISGEGEELIKTMELKDVDLDTLLGTMKKWTGVYIGSAAETVDFDVDDGMSVNYIAEVADEAAALEMFKTMEADMAPVFKLYEGFGIPMTMSFKENVREYKGIKIHHFDMGFKMEGMLPEQKEQFEAMKLDKMGYDVAVFDGLVLNAMGDATIEALIDKVKDPAAKITPIKARTVYPEGAFYYMDWDVGRYVEFVMSMMPKEVQSPMQPQIIAMLQGVDPITSAGFRQNGVVSWSINFPGDLIGKVSQMAMMIQMQKMQQMQQQQMGVPQGMPGGMAPQSVPQSAPMPQTLPAP